MTSDSAVLDGLTDFDRRQWDEVMAWHEKRTTRRQLPKRVQGAVGRGKDVVVRTKDLAAKAPGANAVASAFAASSQSLLQLVGKVAEASVRREAVLKTYTKHGFELSGLEEVRGLDLREVLLVKPRLDLGYTLAATAEGAAAGAALTGGTALAAVGLAPGGAGSAPGVGTIVGVMAADTAAMMAACQRAIAHTAAYYGYDTSLPGESVIAAEVMGFALAGTSTAKNGVYQQLNKVMQDLAHRATWRELNERAAVQVVQKVYQVLGVRLTQKKLAQAIPVIGVAVGAGMNARMLSAVADASDHFYRERFLRDKYGIPLPHVALVEGSEEDVVDVVAIVEEELANEAQETDQDAHDVRGVGLDGDQQ